MCRLRRRSPLYRDLRFFFSESIIPFLLRGFTIVNENFSSFSHIIFLIYIDLTKVHRFSTKNETKTRFLQGSDFMADYG
ncbi:unnamed protein product [Brassica oleracea var. botrytis]